MAFLLQKHVPLAAVAALTADVGAPGQTAVDDQTSDVYVKLTTGWAKVRTGSGAGVPVAVNGPVTVQNSAGTVTRSVTAVNGVAALAASDAIVANGGAIVLQNSSGATSSGNAGLNSPATAIVSAGVVSAVKASA
ncbi:MULTISPECIES: hypothetical protein [Pandoraea]|uniref:hypothetical protein n=1 Tax=Pandoraea TaxID=93217 RepID=UPI001F5D9113|nr:MULTISPECIES: hypothetical protein [Pandoraea]MCI3206557.1 hypothetical protein [Pandoraea sp. LA3]MDN4584585.1 hypothetical protein [Pandoraea capi]